MEHAVFSGHFEKVALQTVAAVYPHAGALEGYDGGVALEFHFLIIRTFRCQALNAISVLQGEQGEAQSGEVFLAWVDAVFEAGVHQHGHACVGHHQLRLRLLLAQQRAVGGPVDEAIVVGGYLAVVEWEVALPPLGAPSAHHGCQHVGVGLVAGHVIFALVPDDTAHGDAYEGVEHAVVEYGGGAVLRFHVGFGGGYFCVGEGFKPVGLHPCFACRTAPRGYDEAYGNAEHAAQFAAEVVGRRAELAHRGGSSLAPVAADGVNGGEAAVALHGEEA